MREYVISKSNWGSGWFNFESLPQECNFIQIHNLYCGTEKKAINSARNLIGDKKAKVLIKEVA